jgi:hypothetical protein
MATMSTYEDSEISKFYADLMSQPMVIWTDSSTANVGIGENKLEEIEDCEIKY